MKNRVTIEDIENEIADESYHRFDGTTVTVCLLVLKNGFTVIGTSACCDKKNFDEQKGREYAREDAVNQLWALLGFRLRDELSKGAK